MKIYLHTDIEGVAGFLFHEDKVVGERSQFHHAERMKRLLTDEVNAALETLVECGADKVVINDSHGNGYNLIFEKLHPVAEIIHGSGNLMPMWLPCIDQSFDAMICLGMHAMAGTNGVLPHSRFDIQCGDGRQITLNEAGLAMALAGYYNVRTIMVTGDTTVCRQVKGYLPDIVDVPVKEALSPYTARSVVPRQACQMIKDGVKRALAPKSTIQPFILSPPPYRMTLTGSTPGFEKASAAFENTDFRNLIKTVLTTIYDYDQYDLPVWPLIARNELILNKHERAYKKRLEAEGKIYQPYLV